MGRSSLLKFLVQPDEVVRGVRRLGLKGALMHGVRRTSASVKRAVLGPAQLRINPMGVVCNHTCPMCWLQHMDPAELKRERRRDREESMGLADYEHLLDTVPPGLTEVNVVGGGEPLVHRDCVDILRAIRARKLRGYLITNGTLLDERVARALVEIRWNLTRVSVHAGDPDTYAVVQGVPHFERLRENLQRFDRLRRADGPPACALHVHHVLQRENLETIPKMFDFAEEVGADNVVFEIIFPLAPDKRLTSAELERARELLSRCAAEARTPSNAEHIVSLLVRERDETGAEERARAERAAAAPSPAQAVPAPGVPVPDAPYRPANRCSVGFDSAFVTSFGDVMPCCFSNEVMGNVREQSFRDIWFGERYAEFRTRLIEGRFADYCSNVRCKLTTFLHD